MNSFFDRHKDEYAKFFQQLDRSMFLEDDLKSMAGIDSPLPIGYGQTISQPSLVLQMTMWLELEKDHKVLEIGTGSGYQTAFLAEFAGEVYTIEVYEPLSLRAQAVLSALNYDNVHFKIGDGSEGWEENGPYDRIMITAAAGSIPDALVDQLKPGGKMLLPLGPPSHQSLTIITKDEAGNVNHDHLIGVRFVEFVGKYGWGSKPPL